MTPHNPNITIPVDLTNPGQFFACCGLLELADRLWPGAEGWFGEEEFHLRCPGTFRELLSSLADCTVDNTMIAADRDRMNQLSAIKKSDRNPALEDEKKRLESLRRELPIVLCGGSSKLRLCVDWFCDDYAGGSRFKTWAGQQSVLDIAQSMHQGVRSAGIDSPESLWAPARNVGLPFNFDASLGSQGSARDVGFSFDPLAANETTRIEGTCTPALELLAFIGLQRFRPFEVKGENRFLYVAWHIPAEVAIAPALACGAVSGSRSKSFEFRLLYRTKYLKSFLPAQPLSRSTL